MDELDMDIIGILQRDGRTSNASMARDLEVSEGTIRRRLKSLVDDETVQILAVVEPSKMGYSTEAIIALQVDLEKIENVGDALSKLPEVMSVSVTAGSFDLFAFVALPSPENLHNFLMGKVGGIQGIRRTETFVTMSVKKRVLIPIS